MNFRERFAAIMHYKPYDRMPVVSLGYWDETLEKWVREGHLKPEEIAGYTAGSAMEGMISRKLGFDDTFLHFLIDKSSPLWQLYPPFEERILDIMPNGHQKKLTEYGVIEIHSPGSQSIHATEGSLLKDRKSWEERYKPRLIFSEDRFDQDALRRYEETDKERDYPLGLFCGSLFGQIRNMLTLEGCSYMMADEPELFEEICQMVTELNFRIADYLLKTNITFDFATFWEDICFNYGPLVHPQFYDEHIGPNYKRITDLVRSCGIDVVSLDCDGLVDALIPTWLNHGVNTLFPIEVGTWNASIKPFREKYGKDLLGIGGMRKHVLALDRKAVDEEVERLRPLVELGGFLPCPDHHLAPDAKWELIQYYTDRMHEVFV